MGLLSITLSMRRLITPREPGLWGAAGQARGGSPIPWGRAFAESIPYLRPLHSRYCGQYPGTVGYCRPGVSRESAKPAVIFREVLLK